MVYYGKNKIMNGIPVTSTSKFDGTPLRYPEFTVHVPCDCFKVTTITWRMDTVNG